MNTKKMLIGFHCNTTKALNGLDEFFEPLRHGKGDFILAHTDPTGRTVAEDCGDAKTFAKICKDNGVDFIANFEKQNFCDIDISEDALFFLRRSRLGKSHGRHSPPERTEGIH